MLPLLFMLQIYAHVYCILPARLTRQLSDAQLEEAGVKANMIRLSVGIENPQDILDDLSQALEQL